jgi:hypothetical protein
MSDYSLPFDHIDATLIVQALRDAALRLHEQAEETCSRKDMQATEAHEAYAQMYDKLVERMRAAYFPSPLPSYYRTSPAHLPRRGL